MGYPDYNDIDRAWYECARCKWVNPWPCVISNNHISEHPWGRDYQRDLLQVTFTLAGYRPAAVSDLLESWGYGRWACG